VSQDFDFSIRVYYADTDAGGVVYHSKYLDFCEKARTEFLRFKNIVQSKLFEEDGIGFVVKNAEIEYKKPAKLDDLLNIKTKIIENNGVVIKIEQEIFRENNESIFFMNIFLVCINKNYKPTRIPKTIQL
jgi:acyl-CoA thioester hydrolase